MRYSAEMIVGFRDAETATIWAGRRSRRLPADIQNAALRKLRLLHVAKRLDDLRVPPGNGLEALKRDRRGQHSIRINDQWRICFIWKDSHAHQVEIVDYH
jgi:proteic killer suppression protein